ncbi:hypothetical protein LCGC14_2203810, partial [marine sediment metagenome]
VSNRSLARYRYIHNYVKRYLKIKDPITFENTQATLTRIHVANQIRDTLIVWENIYDQLTDRAVVRRPNFDELKQSTNKNAIKDAFATWIEQNKSNITGTSLWLVGKQLYYLPKALFKLTQLQELDLRENNLTTLPGEIGNLTQLQSLSLWDNNLTSLPPGIGNLTQLRHLDLTNNNLTSLPGEIGNLTNLHYLNLWNNNLTSLPPEIGNLIHLDSMNRFINASSVFLNRFLLNTIIPLPALKNIPTNLKKVVTVTVMLAMIHLCSDRMFLP